MHLVHDRIAHRSGARRDYRHPGEQAVVQRLQEARAAARQHRDVGVAQDIQPGLGEHRAGEVHQLGELQALRQLPQAGLVLPAAGDHQPRPHAAGAGEAQPAHHLADAGLARQAADVGERERRRDAGGRRPCGVFLAQWFELQCAPCVTCRTS